MGIRRTFQWAKLLVCAFCVLPLLACGPDYERPLRVGANLWAGYEPMFLARDLGYYDGQAIQLVELGGTTQAIDALHAGKLDGAGLTLDEAVTLASDGVPIAVVWVFNFSNGADALVARPEIKSLQELADKRIGVEQTGVGAYMLDAALLEAGLNTQQVRVLSLTADEHLLAYQQGRVDALVTFDPMKEKLLHEGAHLLFDSSKLPGEIVDVLVVRREALTCCLDALVRLVQGQQRALAYLREHREDALKRMSMRSHSTPEETATALAGMQLPDTLQNRQLLEGNLPKLYSTVTFLSSLMMDRRLINSSVSPEALLDDRVVREIKP
ncbi:predicted ABC-type nitrate/sulfonate/bicarbonate transport system protein [gamma proteobacterium HdN1]|nr:predicted ABC-type nitrate/sulfonate/bicarbonate transport system protein [gamma proteobacterium HdN1]